ncbi:hypothetical protein LAZ67_17002259, partial [Cordylochernes scorpioides]
MESVKDEKRVGRPILHRNPEKVSQISNLIKENSRIGLRDIEEETGISKSLVESIIKEDLQLKKTPSKFVPKMLTIQQKENRVEVAKKKKKMLEMVEENPNWKEKVITGDETWVYGYDPETKRQSIEWKGKDEPRTKKSRLCKSKNKVLLVTFFDIKGIVHYEYLEEGQTINKESYLNIMRRVRESIRLKRSEMWSSKNWIIHHAYGDAVMSRRRVFEWYKRFKEGREETADNERTGRQSTSTTPEKVDKVLELVRENRQITVREVAEEAGISFGSTQSIMKDILGVRRLNAVLVPKDLSFDQKNARKETASLNLEATTDDPELLKRVITGDETWIYCFDSETTQQ